MWVLPASPITAKENKTDLDFVTVRSVMEWIKNKTLKLHWQRMFNPSTETFDKTEILTRFATSKWLPIRPYVFMQVIDKYWLHQRFDLVVLEESIALIQSIPIEYWMVYSINLDKRTVADNHPKIIEIIDRTKIDTALLVFELTESDQCWWCSKKQWQKENSCNCSDEYIDWINIGLDKINSATGITFWLDDFPTGSNCMYNAEKLRHVSFVKFDWIWIELLYENIIRTSSVPHLIFIETIRNIMKEVRLINPEIQFVVEKIETKEMFELFQAVGWISHYQWFLFHKPAPLGQR